MQEHIHKHNPIGVFDSGIGGLTVVKEIRKKLPNESIVYFGDTARVPYGTKSTKTIIKFAREDIDFLLVNYNNILSNPKNNISKILDFLDMSDDILDKMIDAVENKLYRQRRS